LIERVNDLDAHENERSDHQIEAKMHERVETKKLPLARADLAKAVNQIQYASERASGPVNSVSATGTEGFRRRGSDAFVANLFLAGGLLFDASFLPVHAP